MLFNYLCGRLCLELKGASISKIIPIVKALITKVTRSQSGLAKHLKDKMNIYFEKMEEKQKLRMATVLDPRFKKRAFRDPKFADMAVEEIKVLMEPEQAQLTVMEETPVEKVTAKPSCLWDEFNEEMETEDEPETQISAVEMEIRYYMELKRMPLDCDPLVWWKDNCSTLPKMAKIAKKILGIPASSVPSERVFSKAGEVISARRSRLQPSNVDMILFLNKN